MKALVRLGWDHYIMDIDEAVVLIRTLEKMTPLESEYVSGEGNRWYVKADGGIPKIGLECLTEDEVAVIKMRGNKPQEKVPF